MDATRDRFDNPESPREGESAGLPPSSATGIFGTVSAPPSRDEEDLLASLSGKPYESTAASPSPAPTVASPPPVQTAGASAGDFTRMLQALKTTDPTGAEPVSRPSEELAKVFRHVSMDEIPSAAGSPSPEIPGQAVPANPSAAASGAREPGAFTQMFQSMNAPQAPLRPPSAPGAPGPGEFTRVFSSMNAEPPADPATEPEVAPAPPPPSASGPGDFSRMFQTLNSGSPARESAPPATQIEKPQSAAPGAFTQSFFGTAPPARQPDSFRPLPPEPAQESGFSFTQASPPSPEPSLPAQGGFTQLLQALNRETAAKAPESILPPPPISSPAPAAGGFTQLLRSLSEQPASLSASPAMAPPAPQPPVAPIPALPVVPSFTAQAVAPPVLPRTPAPQPTPSGPGEFTRVISGSALRDLQASPAATPAPAAAPPARPGWAPPPMPPPPAAAPPAPAPHFAPPAFAFQPPAAPAPPPAPPPGILQKYLPLILIVNVFLMLAIVLILIFVLHHK